MLNQEIIHFKEVKGFCFTERTIIFNEENCNILLNKIQLSNTEQIQILYALYIDLARQENLLKPRNNHGDCNIKMDKTIFLVHHYVDTMTEKIKNNISLENFNMAIEKMEEMCDLNNTWRMANERNKKEKIANNLRVELGLAHMSHNKKTTARLSFRM